MLLYIYKYSHSLYHNQRWEYQGTDDSHNRVQGPEGRLLVILSTLSLLDHGGVKQGAGAAAWVGDAGALGSSSLVGGLEVLLE